MSPQPPAGPGAPVAPRRLLRGSRELGFLVGRRVLVGISYVDPAGGRLDAAEFCGRVSAVGDGVVELHDPQAGEPVRLPADAGAFQPAAPGRYTLRESGEVVLDPDFLSAWTVVVTPEGTSASSRPGQAVG